MTTPIEISSVAGQITDKVLPWLRRLKPRREIKDRRTSGLDQRLKVGFWFAYHRETGAGKFDAVELTPKHHDQLLTALLRDAQQHYAFSDRKTGLLLDPASIVTSALSVIWSEMKGVPREERQAVILVEAVARYLFSKYSVRERRAC